MKATKNRKPKSQPRTSKKWSVTIAWGRDGRPEESDDPTVILRDDPDIEKTTYTFATRQELKAFLEGVSASSGWTEYSIFSGSRVFVANMDGLWTDRRVA